MGEYLYVCEYFHAGNHFRSLTPAIEQDADGIIHEVDAHCSCGGNARRVRQDDALMALPAEDMVGQPLMSRQTEKLL